MKLHTVLNDCLALYVVTGYISAYRYAKHYLMKDGAKQKSSSIIRISSLILLVVMPLSAASALYERRDVPFIAVLIGATMNIFWFFGGCIGLLRGSFRAPSAN